MAFEKFKNEIRKLDINKLNAEMQKRQALMFQWTNPEERHIAGVAGKNWIHPFYKIRKEMAIIHTFIHQEHLKVMKNGSY